MFSSTVAALRQNEVAQAVLRVLPVLSFPTFKASEVELYTLVQDFIPDLNLYMALPILLGLVLLLVSDGLNSRKKSSVFWLLVAVVGGGYAFYRFLDSVSTEAVVATSVLSAIAVVGILLGWGATPGPSKEPSPAFYTVRG